jgi:SAM-dependent methyltransferase
MTERSPEHSVGAWSQVGLDLLGQEDQRIWRGYCDQLYVSLLDRWLSDDTAARRALKTDLYDEALDEGLVGRLGQSAQGIFGMDLSLPTVHAAGRRHKTLAAAQMDARALPYRAGSFDLVLSNSTLDHFPTTEEIDLALAELARVTRPGGTLVISLDNLSNPIIRLRQALPSSPLRRTGLVPYYVGMTHNARGMEAALERAGFEVAETAALMHCPRVAMVPIARALSKRGRSGERFTRFLMSFERLEHLPTRFLSAHYVAARAIRRPVP